MSEVVEAKNDADREVAEKALHDGQHPHAGSRGDGGRARGRDAACIDGGQGSLLRILGAMGGPKALQTIADGRQERR